MSTSTQCKLRETARVRSATQMGHYSILSFASSAYDCTPFMGYVILMQTYSTGTSRVQKSNNASTGNLHKHIAFCVPQSNESKIMEKFAAGCTYSHKGFCWLVMCWVVCKNRPYTIIDDEEVYDIFQMLHVNVNIPCANTLVGDIKLTHSMMRDKLIKLFEVCLTLAF